MFLINRICFIKICIAIFFLKFIITDLSKIKNLYTLIVIYAYLLFISSKNKFRVLGIIITYLFRSKSSPQSFHLKNPRNLQVHLKAQA